jgi:hypothetical protein
VQPIITITCAFTRRWAVERWLENLASVQHDPAMTNLVFIVDIDEPFIMSRLKRFVEGKGYRKEVFVMNRDHNPNEVRVAERRQRIAAVKNQSKQLVAQCDGNYVISLEDDTVFEGLDLMRLLTPLIEHPQEYGVVQGVQCGRWGIKMIGAWSADNTIDPHKVETILPSDEYASYQRIAAGGFYGYATHKALYVNHEYYSSTAQPWGPDVNYGLWVSNMGFEVLIDWKTVFGHNDHNVILLPDETLTRVIYTKDQLTGNWSRQDADRTIEV